MADDCIKIYRKTNNNEKEKKTLRKNEKSLADDCSEGKTDEWGGRKAAATPM